MIRLSRRPKPQVLVDNEARWTDEYMRRIDGDDSVPAAAATRYRHPDIKATLVAETHGKCAYCESRPTHVHPGDSEHIRPKSKHPDRVVQWKNLLFACPDCNRAKGDYDDEAEPLVNPFVEEPADFLRFFGPMVFQVPGSSRGLITIRQLQLDRPELFERRKERLEKLQTLLDRWVTMEAGPAKDAVRDEVLAEAGDDREYAAAVRAFFAQQPVLAPASDGGGWE